MIVVYKTFYFLSTITSSSPFLPMFLLLSVLLNTVFAEYWEKEQFFQNTYKYITIAALTDSRG